MGKILVTGATGHLGQKTLEHLLQRVPASELLGLARDPAKAAKLTAKGIEIRQGDYSDFDSLVSAFQGVEKIMLIGAQAFTDRNAQHYNVISAAREAGVKHIAYTAIVRKEGSDFILPQATEEDLFCERTLKESGIPFTIVRQPPFLDTLPFTFGDKAYEVGVRVPAGTGKVGALTRNDIALAQAAILSESGHEHKDYSLVGSPSVSFADIASILSNIRGIPVPYIEVSERQYIDDRVAQGLPEPVAEFALAWVQGVNRGEWEQQTGDLERLIGRKPTTAEEYLRDNYPVPHPELEATPIN